MSLKFYPEEHKYIDTDNPEKQWISVTRLVEKFVEPFDEVKIAEKCSKNKKSKWYKMAPEDIIRIWNNENKRSTELGTWYHEQRENDVLNCNTITRNGKELQIINGSYEDGIKIAPSQILTEGIYPEHFVYLDSVGICGQSDWVEVCDGKVYILDYKGVPLDTDILTINGFKKMIDIKVGDIIYDGNGNQTKVEHVSQIHHNPCVKIIFDNNSEIICDEEHRWNITEWKSKNNYHQKEVTTKEIVKQFMIGKTINIQVAGSLNNDKIELPIDPYILGIWLGDGSKADGVVTKPNDDLWNEVSRRGYNFSHDYSKSCNRRAQTRRLYGFRTELIKCNLLNNKHIPDVYFNSSYEQRLDLLRGIMDTDGYFNKCRNRFVVNTTSEQFAKDICSLVSSLGWKCTIINTTAYCTNGKNKEKKKAYNATFITDGTSPFLIRNNIQYEFKHHQKLNSNFLRVKSIGYIETVPTKCLTVDSDDHTYLITKNFIRTHNSNKHIDTESYVDFKGRHKMMLKPLKHIQDCNFYHYALQLSTYMYIVLRHNPQYEPGSLKIQHVSFKQLGEDKYGYPILERDTNGDPIVSETTIYELPYLKKEVKLMIDNI